jgi:hypothetical protein
VTDAEARRRWACTASPPASTSFVVKASRSSRRGAKASRAIDPPWPPPVASPSGRPPPPKSAHPTPHLSWSHLPGLMMFARFCIWLPCEIVGWLVKRAVKPAGSNPLPQSGTTTSRSGYGRRCNLGVRWTLPTISFRGRVLWRDDVGYRRVAETFYYQPILNSPYEPAGRPRKGRAADRQAAGARPSPIRADHASPEA